MSATIIDVAKEAGCSKSTVSRYLNGSELIAEETRRRVALAVEALNYRPDEIGRSLQRQLTRTIGVLAPSLSNPVFASSLAGIQAHAREKGLSVIVATSDYDAAIELAAVETLLANRVRGLILTLCSAVDSKALDLVQRSGRPFVLLFNQSDTADRLSVSVDNISAARAMVTAMIELGHRRIAFLAGRFSASDRSRLRYQGYLEAVRAAGCEALDPLEADFAGAEADRRMRRIFSENSVPTALLCSTDILALAAIASLRTLGLDVPKDVSVAGFDGIAIGEMVHPTLATVVQPKNKMGRLAAEILVEQIAGNEPMQTSSLLDYELRLGGTLGPVPGREGSPLKDGAKAKEMDAWDIS